MMRLNPIPLLILFVMILAVDLDARPNLFVKAKGGSFYVNGKLYRFVGANYWYGGLLGLEKDKKQGIERLRKELDFLRSQGVSNLRLMGGAEGSGLLNGVTRVGPPLQPEQNKFDESVLEGLDIVLAEMARRKMKAVIFFSNNWEWSGGFQQYLIWNGVVPGKWLAQKPTWDELRDITAKFYTCRPCMDGYRKQTELILGRTNKLSGMKYTDDPAIMAWELANEPRPMRPAANDAYRRWIKETAAMIKSKDRNHLVTLGHEGYVGTEDIKLFDDIHADSNIDYLTIHIWPKNWSWFASGKLAEGLPTVVAKTEDYIKENTAVAMRLNKPLVLEEFGLPRDGESLDPYSTTGVRDSFFERVFSQIGRRNIAGANFWAFGGTARPAKGQVFWKAGDEYMGDPPMEEQGLNSVFDRDSSTWKVIRRFAASSQRRNRTT